MMLLISTSWSKFLRIEMIVYTNEWARAAESRGTCFRASCPYGHAPWA
jgi:hypothetical protein